MLNLGDNRNFQRLSGTAFFQPTGVAGLIGLGNIVMHKLDPKIERKDIMRYKSGVKFLGRMDVLGYNPEYQIDQDEFNTVNLPIVLWGTQAADTVQAATGAVTATINGALPGQFYALGGYVQVAVTAVTLTAGGAALVASTDYVVDAQKGLITFLSGGAVPKAGANVTVAFSAPAVTRETFLPFTNLQQRGTLQLYENDSPEDVNMPLHAITYPVTLYCDSPGDVKVEDNTKATLRARLTGPGRVLRRVDNPLLAY